MAFNLGTGTELDPYIIESATMWNAEVPGMASGEFAKVQDATTLDFSETSGNIERATGGITIDLNGQNLIGITGFLDSGSTIDHLFRDASISNGALDMDVSVSTGDLRVIIGLNAVDYSKLKFTGSLTNTGTGDVSIIRSFFSGATHSDIFADMVLTINGGVAAPFGVDSNQVSEGTHIISVCTFSGSGTYYGFSASTLGTSTMDGCYWDETISGVTNNASNNSQVVGKTTTQLQTLSTYTDTGQTELATPYSIATFANYVDETWAIDTNSYPVLDFDFVPPSEPTLSVTLNSVAESGVDVVLMQFDDKNLLNPVVVDKGVTDVNGDYTYSGGIDDTKVFGYIVNKPNSGDASLANGTFRLATLNVS